MDSTRLLRSGGTMRSMPTDAVPVAMSPRGRERKSSFGSASGSSVQSPQSSGASMASVGTSTTTVVALLLQ